MNVAPPSPSPQECHVLFEWPLKAPGNYKRQRLTTTDGDKLRIQTLSDINI